MQHERIRLIDHSDKCHFVEIGEDTWNHIEEVFRAAHRPLDAFLTEIKRSRDAWELNRLQRSGY